MRLSHCGTSALLLDVAHGAFDLNAQQKLWGLLNKDSPLKKIEGISDCVLGVNNLLICFDPLKTELDSLKRKIEKSWSTAKPMTNDGKLIEVPVRYDIHDNSELCQLAKTAQLSVDEAISLHTAVDYVVACIGAVPGFPYLVGLNPRLSAPRRATPRPDMPKGAVAIGGAQTGIIPMLMPSGWNQIGSTELCLFDPTWPAPSLLAPGDLVRFIAC